MVFRRCMVNGREWGHGLWGNGSGIELLLSRKRCFLDMR